MAAFGDLNDERFGQLESMLNQLNNSQRHLLTAQVLSKAESLLERVAERMDLVSESLQKLTVKVDKLADQVQIQADGQKHSDARIDALADMVRHLIERNGKHLQ